MPTTLKLPIRKDIHAELADCYLGDDGKNMSQTMFDNIKIACKDAKSCLREGKAATPQKDKDGRVQQVEVDVSEKDLARFKLDSNPAWLPKGMRKEDVITIDRMVGDTTTKYFDLYCQLVMLRHEKYNESDNRFFETIKTKMMATIPDKKSYDKWLKTNEDAVRERDAGVPNCKEQILYDTIYPQLIQLIDAKDDEMFDNEDKALNKTDES